MVVYGNVKLAGYQVLSSFYTNSEILVKQSSPKVQKFRPKINLLDFEIPRIEFDR